MKLSMWMIANRLSSLDIELDIREDAPVILNSARRAYATNCVWVYACLLYTSFLSSGFIDFVNQ